MFLRQKCSPASALALTLGNLIIKVGGRLTAYSHLEVSYPHYRWRPEKKKKIEVEKKKAQILARVKDAERDRRVVLFLWIKSSSWSLFSLCCELRAYVWLGRRISSLLKEKNSPAWIEKGFFSFPALAGGKAQLRVAVIRVDSSRAHREASAPEAPAARAPFQDLFSCGQRPLIQLAENLTSTRRPALRHSRRIRPITAPAVPRASPPTWDAILRRIATIGWWGSLQPMTRGVDRRVHQCRKLVKRPRDQGVNDHIFNFN